MPNLNPGGSLGLRLARALHIGRSASSAARAFGAAAGAAPPSGATLDDSEVRKFAALSHAWWQETGGPFAGLHRLNAVRVPLVRDAVLRGAAAAFAPPPGPVAEARGPLAGRRLLDVGCGGGILSEALARLGAHVTGLDAAAANVAAARLHASLDPHAFGPGRLAYVCATAEQLATEAATAGSNAGLLFDGVVCSEVAEHVADLGALAAALSALARPGGCVVVTTINRTLPSFFLAIVAAEYVLRVVPPGTHDWAKFVSPGELSAAFARNGLAAEGALVGLRYDALRSREWSAVAGADVNYAMVFRKPLS